MSKQQIHEEPLGQNPTDEPIPPIILHRIIFHHARWQIQLRQLQPLIHTQQHNINEPHNTQTGQITIIHEVVDRILRCRIIFILETPQFVNELLIGVIAVFQGNFTAIGGKNCEVI